MLSSRAYHPCTIYRKMEPLAASLGSSTPPRMGVWRPDKGAVRLPDAIFDEGAVRTARPAVRPRRPLASWPGLYSGSRGRLRADRGRAPGKRDHLRVCERGPWRAGRRSGHTVPGGGWLDPGVAIDATATCLRQRWRTPSPACVPADSCLADRRTRWALSGKKRTGSHVWTFHR